jgi:hypothetical protein
MIIHYGEIEDVQALRIRVDVADRWPAENLSELQTAEVGCAGHCE